MNIKDYISSGIIESYVLGLASAEESKEYELLRSQYPELAEAQDVFEQDLEKQALGQSIPAPADTRDKIWSELGLDSKTETPVVRMGWLRYAVAASVILLAGSLYWNLSLRNKNQELANALNESQNLLAQARDTLSALAADASVIQKPGMKMAALRGMPTSPQSYATVYWDTTSKDVYLMVNNLPQPPSNKQYQLWAIINGQPVDIGVLSMTEKPMQLYRMRNTQHAQAFAITLEEMGGSPVPKGDMYVMGNL